MKIVDPFAPIVFLLSFGAFAMVTDVEITGHFAPKSRGKRSARTQVDAEVLDEKRDCGDHERALNDLPPRGHCPDGARRDSELASQQVGARRNEVGDESREVGFQVRVDPKDEKRPSLQQAKGARHTFSRSLKSHNSFRRILGCSTRMRVPF